MNRTLLAFLLILSACGYRVESGDKISVSVPYVIGDHEGELTDALVQALAQTANFHYAHSGGEWILKAKILSASNDRIGYRYDRDPESEKVRKNVIATENRKEITVEVCVENAITGNRILGPQKIKSYADYDYVDSNSRADLSFIDPSTGVRATSIAFSLGQLDSVGAAGENAIYPIYRQLAQRIVEGLIATGGYEVECE